MEEPKEAESSTQESDTPENDKFNKNEFTIYADKVSDGLDVFYVKSDEIFKKLKKIINNTYQHVKSFFKGFRKEKDVETVQNKIREKIFQQNLRLEKKLKKIEKGIDKTKTLAGEIKEDTSRIVLKIDEVLLIVNHQMEALGKLDDIEKYMKEHLASDWDQIKYSWNRYKNDEISRGEFTKKALKKLGKKFLSIFVNMG
ncbi:hypothetical protein LCGC14_0689380 [marine sediment metagenome]|uniref:Uncharacterized protein n=1 Tax=marine sediment metagenome TaxID=412755 RepID=A0A0F9T768_9ZZZZ